jgi:predicted transposase/invertase (TIGR01784 family)
MTSKFLDPKNDIAFKKIFGTEQNKDILIHFLDNVLWFEDKPTIKTVEFLKTVQDPKIADQKQSIVEILCQDASGVKYIIEIQLTKTKRFDQRLFYAQAYCQQVERRMQYPDLKEMIFIVIADCVIFPEKNEYISYHALLDKKTFARNLKDFSFTFIELPKFKKEKPEELETSLEEWCYFFKYAAQIDSEDFLKIIGKDQVIRKAYEALDQFCWTEPELYRYGYEEGIEGRESAS